MGSGCALDYIFDFISPIQMLLIGFNLTLLQTGSHRSCASQCYTGQWSWLTEAMGQACREQVRQLQAHHAELPEMAAQSGLLVVYCQLVSRHVSSTRLKSTRRSHCSLGVHSSLDHKECVRFVRTNCRRAILASILVPMNWFPCILLIRLTNSISIDFCSRCRAMRLVLMLPEAS